MLSTHHAQHLQQCVPWRGQTCAVRRLRLCDAPAMYAFARLRSTCQHMSWDPHASVQDTERYLSIVLEMYSHDAEAPWAITGIHDDVCVGFVGFTQFCAEHLRSDFAIGLHPDVYGRGMAQEACSFLIQQGRAMGLVRIQAVVETQNVASQRLMERLGLQEKSLLQNYLVGKAGSVDAYLYATVFPENAIKR